MNILSLPGADTTTRLCDGTPIRLRPPRPADADALGRLVESLSPADRRRRFHGAVAALPDRVLARMCRPDADDTVAFVAEDVERGALVGDVRAVRDATGHDAEFALMVGTGWQRRGLGRLALGTLCAGAAARGWHWLYGHVQADNRTMLALAARCGFRPSAHRGDPGIVVVETRIASAWRAAA